MRRNLTPSLVIIGEPKDFCSMTFLPQGPRVIFTVCVSFRTPRRMAWRASLFRSIIFAAMAVSFMSLFHFRFLEAAVVQSFARVHRDNLAAFRLLLGLARQTIPPVVFPSVSIHCTRILSLRGFIFMLSFLFSILVFWIHPERHDTPYATPSLWGVTLPGID